MTGQATVTIGDRKWSVSIASSPWELTQGLGGIPEMAPETGMLFDMGWEQIIQVTTVPMLFLLDIAFLSEDMVVLEVYRSIEPGYIVNSTLPARYFLEVNAGELNTIDAGDKASIELLISEELTVIPEWVSSLISLASFIVVGIFMVDVARTSTKQLLTGPESTKEATREW